MSENFVFLVILDACDVVYNWSISLLPPIVRGNLFACISINNLIIYCNLLILKCLTLLSICYNFFKNVKN